MIAAAIFFIVMFTIIWLGIVVGVSASTPFLANFFPEQEMLFVIGMLNLLFTVGIPILAVIFLIFRLVFSRRIGKGWTIALTILWFINVFSFTAIAGHLGQEFVEEGQVSQTVTPENFRADTLNLAFSGATGRDNESNTFRIGGEIVQFPGAEVRFSIVPSADKDWHLTQIAESRGRSREEARKLAANITAPIIWNQEIGLLAAPKELPFQDLQKWRVQEILLEIAMPAGAYVKMEDDVYYRTSMKGGHMPGNVERIYQMGTNGQLICSACPAPSDMSTSSAEEEMDDSRGFKDYSTLHIHGPLKVTIEQGDTYKIATSGDQKYLDQVEFNQEGDRLTVDLPLEKVESSVRVFLTLPSVESLALEQTDDIRIKGFDADVLDIQATGDFELKVDVRMDEVKLTGTEGVQMEFVGSTENMIAKFTEESRLDTDRGNVTHLDLNAQGGSRIKINQTTQISSQEMSEDSKLRIVN